MAVYAASISVSFQILLPVVPVMAEHVGPHGIGGAATAALSAGAVAGELVTPWLMTVTSSKRLLVLGQLVTGIASLVYVVPALGSNLMIAGALVRGMGMGVTIVVAVAVLSDLTADNRRGTAVGQFGLALSLPGIFVPSLGVYLLSLGHVDVDAAIACVSGVLGSVIAIFVPGRAGRGARAAGGAGGASEGPESGSSAGVLASLRQPRLMIVLFGFVLISCSFGGLFTYVPIALPLAGAGSAASFLLVAGVARALSRWLAGPLGDRRSVRRIVLIADGMVLCSLALVAVHIAGAPLLGVAFLYGLGYGAIQTTAFLALSQSTWMRDAGTVSALWNTATDLGSAFGGGMLGLAAAQYGYLNAVWVLPAAVLISVPLLATALVAPKRGVEHPVAVAK